MKKILSCVLAVALVLSLMSMTVFAGEEAHPNNGTVETNKAYRVVGTQGDNKDYTDGVEISNFAPTTAGADVSLQFNKKNQDGTFGEDSIIQSRYAVDITYWGLVIDLGEVLEETAGENTTYTYVWNVNTYEYDLVDSAGQVVNPEQSNDTSAYTIEAFEITNHSDQSIYYSAEVELNNNVAAANMNAEITINNPEVGAATAAKYDNAGTKTPGEATTGPKESIVVTPVHDWLQSVNNMIGSVDSGAVVGHLTVTISATQN